MAVDRAPRASMSFGQSVASSLQLVVLERRLRSLPREGYGTGRRSRANTSASFPRAQFAQAIHRADLRYVELDETTSGKRSPRERQGSESSAW